MRSLVQSVPLRIVYLLTGGVPALYLATLCTVFLPSTFLVAHTHDAPGQFEAVLATLLLSAAIVGTISGWLSFFAVGTGSKAGRIAHSVSIGGGVLASIYFLFMLPTTTLSIFLLGAGPALVGCCLLFHIRRGAQPCFPADRREDAAPAERRR